MTEKRNNFLDNVIEFFAPERAYRREAYRALCEEMRQNYDAGGYGRVNNNWRVFNQTAEMTDRYDRDTVRARARDLERNSDMMNSVISAYKRNVIGGGYTLQAMVEGNETLNKQIETAWKRWCRKQNCDITKTQSLNQMLRMAVKRKKVDGGIIFIKCYSKGGIVPFKLQAVEVDELDSTHLQPHYSGNRVIGGVEVNSVSEPVGYWFRQIANDGYTYLDPKFIPAKNVITYWTKSRPTQIREMCDVAPTVTRIRDTNEFMTAVSVKERIAACLSVFIKKQIPTTGIGRNHAGSGNSFSYDGKTIAPGMIKELNAGDEIQVVNPSGQSTDAAQFIKLQQRLIGAGQGLSYEATSRDMSESNYSSARQGIIEDGETYTEDIELVQELLDEIYESFVISGVLCGLFVIPNFWENKDNYFEHQWFKASKPWIDPVKESNANKIALQTCQKTFKEICAENGKDWRKQLEDTFEVLEYAKEKGYEIGGVILGQNEQSIENVQKSDDDSQSEADGESDGKGSGENSADE